MSFRAMLTTPPPFRQACNGVTFIALLFLTSYCGIITVMPLFLASFALRLRSARVVTDSIISTWYAFAAGLYELLFGVKIVVKGDTHLLKEKSCALIIMNHRTRLDWLFLFSLQARFGSLKRFKISLKSGLKQIPGAGWAMQAASFIFLHRSWETDRPYIETLLKHYERLDYKPQILLFPEGTDLTESNKAKSLTYAKQHELPVFEHLLHPRTTGFTSITNFMKSHNKLGQVVDVTVLYPYNHIQSETDLFYCDLPREIVFHVRVFDANTLPTDQQLLERWIEERWTEKEQLLKTFYETGKFQENCHSNGRIIPRESDLKPRLYIALALVSWLFVVIASITLLVMFSHVRWFYIASSAIYVVISSYVGFENLWVKLTL